MNNFSLNLLTLTNIFEKASTIILIPILANYFGKEIFGFWTQIQTLIPLFLLILLLNLDNFLVNQFSKKNIHEFKLHLSKIFLMIKVNIFIILGLLIFQLVFPDVISIILFNSPENSLFIFIVLAYFFSEALTSTSITLSKVSNSHSITGMALFLKLVIKLFCIGAIIILDLSLTLLLFMMSILNIILALTLILIILKETGFKFDLFLKKPFTILRSSMLFSFITAGMFLAATIDRFIVLYLLGIEEVAVFSAAWSIGSLSVIAFFIFVPIIYPIFSASKDLDNYEVKNSIQKFNSVFFIIFVPCIYIFFHYANELFLMFKIQFLLNSNIQLTLIAASVGAITYFNYLILLPLVSMEKRLVFYSLVSIIILKILLIYFFVVFNYEFMGIGSIVSVIFGSLLLFNFSKLNFRQLANFKSILQPIWIIGISFCLSFLLTQNLSISSIQNLFIEILFIGALALIFNKELRGLFLIKE